MTGAPCSVHRMRAVIGGPVTKPTRRMLTVPRLYSYQTTKAAQLGCRAKNAFLSDVSS